MVILMEPSTDEIEFHIGQRVSVSDHRGTVMYVGPIPPTKGIWLGIDWDSPTRGKHNGSCNGVQYFSARYETSGSFVRVEKVNRGQTIASAIRDRYGFEDSIMDESKLHEVEKAINAPFLMMVGFEKVAKKQSFESLTIVGVRELNINSAGKPGELKEMCPAIEELDLACNLVTSWQTIYDITSQLENLIFLDISENKLSYLDCDLDSLKEGFRKLQFLVMSKVNYTWEDIMHCAVMWPHICKFQASHNEVSKIHPIPPGIFHNLSMLNLEGNNIKDWSEVMNLGHLPNLEILNLCNTGLTSISIPANSNVFPALQFILLSMNFINNWESISELDKLVNLQELKLRQNPILSSLTPATGRQMIIARLAKLKVLNGEEILDEERRGAEYDYLKLNGKAWLESKQSPRDLENFCSLHPRYPELVKKYGEIDVGELEVKSTALKNKLTKVKLVKGDKVFYKKLPQEMTVQRLVGLTQKVFDTYPHVPELTLVSSRNPSVHIPLDNSLKPLNYYSIEEEDEILVS